MAPAGKKTQVQKRMPAATPPATKPFRHALRIPIRLKAPNIRSPFQNTAAPTRFAHGA
jgi:hypothetical protein